MDSALRKTRERGEFSAHVTYHEYVWDHSTPDPFPDRKTNHAKYKLDSCWLGGHCLGRRLHDQVREDTGPASGGSSGGGYTPTPNGVGIGEQEACEMLRDAFDKHASRLSCTYTLPECPAYIRAGQAPVCSKYDEGTVKGCADFYAGFTSCSEFQKRPCHIMNIEGSAPTGCPDDAGVSDSEEPTEAGEPDAEEQVDGGEPDAEE